MKITEDIIKEIDKVQPELSIQDEFFNRLRANAKEGVMQLGLPHAKQEAYKYSNPAKWFKPLRSINGTSEVSTPDEDLSSFDIPELKTINIILNNGSVGKGIMELPKGITVEPLIDAYKRQPKLVMKALEVKSREDVFDLLNVSLLNEGTFIHVHKGAVIEHPVQLINFLSSQKGNLSNSNILLYVEEGAICKFIERQFASDESELISQACKVLVEANANLEYYLLQDDAKLKLINNYNIQLGSNAVFKTSTITLNASWLRNNLSIFIAGEHVETHLDGVFVIDNDQHLDNHTLVSHDLPNCESHQLYKGLLGGRSTGVFNGRIYVKKDAQKTNAYQSSKNILLSDHSTINAKPELEIYADDVKCSHGSSTGKLDEEAMFYLRSRGLGESSAKKILLQAFANDVLEKIQIEAFRDYLSNEIAARIKGIEM